MNQLKVNQYNAKENYKMISAKDVWSEIKKPEDVKDDDAILKLIYKAVCMGIRLLLDVRYKLYYGDASKSVKFPKKRPAKKQDNAVIKATDIILGDKDE